jgi:hypothetical protein
MHAAADDLDKLASDCLEHCRCGECGDAPAEDQAAASPSDLAPPLATPTIAGRSSRSCST